ncbi:MAG TPA: RNA polymerase sigma factor, partial [Baekduia sp.]|nr:RNA polymerase sigma factor [Baekduia sp.]
MRRPDAEDLWRRFGAGDGSAFAQLYRDHHRDVFRYCCSLLHDEEDAHDAAQGTWAAIWNAPGAARREVPLRPWLFRVAHNEAISVLRRRQPHDELTGLEVPALDDVASDVELRDRLATLRADLVSLPERQRAALLLREVGGLGHSEIGDVFGISAAAAKQTIYEARRALLEAEGGRSMDCDLVQRAISDGDGRVRRGRRLRAHLRGCATCRTFAEAMSRRRRDLDLLFPAPAGIGLMAQAAAGSGAGGVAGGSLVAAGAPVAAKVAVVAVVLAAGATGRHEIDVAVHGGTASHAAVATE